MRRFIAWQGLDAWRAEAATIVLEDGSLQAAGVQIGAGHRLEYELETDSRLITKRLGVRASDEGGERDLVLERSDQGGWTANGVALPHVAGALDCDLALSPLTNFMPAARLTGEPADHVMAWVSVPGLTVERSEQRYEPIDARRVRYVGLDHDFSAELELDEDGFVVRYPGLAERAG
jgi:hypothetical protein